MKMLLATIAAAGMLSAADMKLGKPLTAKEPVSIATVVAHPDQYDGKTIQIKGKITEVCQAMGCWMDLVNEDGQKIRIDVHGADIEFPKESIGKMAVAEGKFSKIELTKEQAISRAKEEAEEKGRKFDPASVKSGVTVFEIRGSGAVILSN